MQSTFAQDIMINGTVTDAADGSPLPGVNVLSKEQILVQLQILTVTIPLKQKKVKP